MIVLLKDAMQTVDDFERLLDSNGISVPANASTGADMLSIWNILKCIRNGFSGAPDDLRKEYTAGMAIHDMAAKVLAVENHPDFKQIVPHLKMLMGGAVHLTEEPTYNSADVYNKLIEAYWACLLMANDVNVEIDDPKNSTGFNPDVIAKDAYKSRAYAFKTIRSPYTQSLLEHLKKGVDQIERSPADEGIVAFQLTPRIIDSDLWPKGGAYIDWRVPAAKAVDLLVKMISKIVIENGQPAVDAVFAGKKAVGAVLCLAIFPTVARNPETGNAVVMPIKVAILVELAPSYPISKSLHSEIELANDAMQRKL